MIELFFQNQLRPAAEKRKRIRNPFLYQTSFSHQVVISPFLSQTAMKCKVLYGFLRPGLTRAKQCKCYGLIRVLGRDMCPFDANDMAIFEMD